MIVRMSIISLLVLLLQGASVSAEPLSLRDSAEMLHLIRREKLDVILPKAMRDNGVDMWIHVVREGDADPLSPHFGDASGYLVFTDRGGERIERAIFGSGGNPDLFDIFGSTELSFAIAGYEQFESDPKIYDELSKFIAERDPQVIAVNYSRHYAIADGVSHTRFLQLTAILGPKYAGRVVSAEDVITDFRVRRVQSEVAAFARALELHRRILEKALSVEVITPGVTTLADVGWWVAEEKQRQGLSQSVSLDVSIPRILFSAAGVASNKPDARWWVSNPDYVIKRGDFLTFDISVRFLDYFTTDYKRNAYIMREGETEIPESIQTAFANALRAHDIMRPLIRAGRTAKETLDILVAALESEGYIYTPFIDIGTEDYRILQAAMKGKKQPGFSIDLHSMGNNAGSLVTLGPSVAPFRSDRFDLVIQQNHLFAFEFMVHTHLPERPGFPISINIEGNHVVTSNGVEYLHPRNERIRIIR